METDALEQEMNYPNPVERSDLPVKRRRWPKIASGVGVLLLLCVVLLPQILSSRIGRKIVVGYIAGKTNSPVTIESVSTSWFGGTSIRHLTIKDPMGRRIGFKQLRCEASLWKLLRGRYDLGDCTVDDLSIEYVIDDGRGKDSFDYMSGPAKGPAGAAPPPSAGGGSNELPRVSGKIKLNNGALILWRGTVQPKLYDVTWERARFTGINGEIDIASSLDQPWRYSLSAISVEDGTDQKGAVASSGTVDLGEGGKFSADDLTADITLDGADVRAGPLAAALIPSLTRLEAREIFGPSLTKLKLSVKAADGEVMVQTLEAQSPVSRIAARATIDVSSTPAVLSVSGESTDQSPSKPVTIALGVSKRLAGNWFVYFNPFFREAVGGSGVVTVTLDSLSMPLSAGGWWTMTAQGRMKAEQVKLARLDEMRGEETTPDNLASQLAMLVGDSAETVPLAFEAPFGVGGGKVKVESMPVAVGPVAMVMSGTTDLRSGGVEMKAALAPAPPQGVGVPPLVGALAQARAVFAIGGTVDRPQLMVANPVGNLDGGSAKMLADQINEQIAKLRAKEAQRQMQKSQKEVDDILKPLRGMDQQHRAATQRAATQRAATTTPAGATPSK